MKGVFAYIMCVRLGLALIRGLAAVVDLGGPSRLRRSLHVSSARLRMATRL